MSVQDGPTSIKVTWTPPSPLGDTTGYRISYTGGGGSSDSVDVDGSTNSHTLMGLTNGETYTISIVGTSSSSSDLPSAPVEAGIVALSKNFNSKFQPPFAACIPHVHVRSALCIYFLTNGAILYPTVPSAAVLSGTTSPSSTAITITGSVPSGSVVTEFEVRWQRDTSVGCSDEDEDTISETGAFPNSYQISGLEPGNRYTITVTVSNAAGTAPASISVTGTTLETGEGKRLCVTLLLFYVLLSTAPNSTVISLSAGTVTANSITVQWEELPCLHRSGEITGYAVVARTSGEDERVVNVNDGNARSAIVSGLTPNTQYTVSVTAVNSAGTGPPSGIDIMTCKYILCLWLGDCTVATHIEPVYFCIHCTPATGSTCGRPYRGTVINTQIDSMRTPTTWSRPLSFMYSYT